MTKSDGERRISLHEKPAILTLHSDKNIESVSADDLGELTDLSRRRRERIARSSRDTARAERVYSSEPLTAYRYDPNLARSEKVAVTVKTTLQLHKNDRQEEQIKKPSPDVFGREVARSYVYGFVGAFCVLHDRFQRTL